MSDLVERLLADELPGETQWQREARIELFSLLKEAADRIKALEAALQGARTLCGITTRGSIAKAIELIDRALEATDARA